MRNVGVRELRQYASTFLRDVEAGETITITHHGHPIAHLVPATTDPWTRLITTGEVAPAHIPTAQLLATPIPTYPPLPQ